MSQSSTASAHPSYLIVLAGSAEMSTFYRKEGGRSPPITAYTFLWMQFFGCSTLISKSGYPAAGASLCELEHSNQLLMMSEKASLWINKRHGIKKTLRFPLPGFEALFQLYEEKMSWLSTVSLLRLGITGTFLIRA